MGLLEPSSGAIRIDGRLLDDALRGPWQRQLAHVPQSIYLADDSIAANIAFGVDEAVVDPDRLAEAIEIAQLAPLVESLPGGLTTPVGELGLRLSGGERQRIGIARALYKNAPLLILDEATSALDEPTEAVLLGAIAARAKHATLILIAHRASTLAGCDRIVRMAGGRIAAETGGGGGDGGIRTLGRSNPPTAV